MKKLIASLFVLSLLSTLACHDIHLDYTERPGEITVFDDLYSVSAADDKNAVAVGYYGSAYFTGDSGETWQRGVTGTLVSPIQRLHGVTQGRLGCGAAGPHSSD